jgi:predicted nucleic acid-binding protein
MIPLLKQQGGGSFAGISGLAGKEDILLSGAQAANYTDKRDWKRRLLEKQTRRFHPQRPKAVQDNHIITPSCLSRACKKTDLKGLVFMLREIYFGKVIPWERKNRKCAEQAEIVKKIEDEERYFVQKMSLDDCKRFQKLSNLYSQLAMSEEGEIFSYGFTMGAMLMMDMMDEAEFMKIE